MTDVLHQREAKVPRPYTDFRASKRRKSPATRGIWRKLVLENYTTPEKTELNRSKRFIWAGDYKTAREISPYADDPEFILVH